MMMIIIIKQTYIGTVHTAPFSYENGGKLIRFGLALTLGLLRCKNGAV